MWLRVISARITPSIASPATVARGATAVAWARRGEAANEKAKSSRSPAGARRRFIVWSKVGRAELAADCLLAARPRHRALSADLPPAGRRCQKYMRHDPDRTRFAQLGHTHREDAHFSDVGRVAHHGEDHRDLFRESRKHL